MQNNYLNICGGGCQIIFYVFFYSNVSKADNLICLYRVYVPLQELSKNCTCTVILIP